MNTTYPYSSEMPVSARYYQRLIERVSDIITALDRNDEKIFTDVMYLVNIHLGRKHSMKTLRTTAIMSRIIFETIKADIDTAIERSRRARAAATRRRALKTRPDNPTKPQHSAPSDPSDLSDLSDNSDPSDRSANSEKSELSEKSERSEKSETSETSEKSELSERSEKSSPSENPKASHPHKSMRLRFKNGRLLRPQNF